MACNNFMNEKIQENSSRYIRWKILRTFDGIEQFSGNEILSQEKQLEAKSIFAAE